MYPFAISLIAGLSFVLVYRKARHETIMPQHDNENIALSWLKIIIVASVPVIIVWTIWLALKPFPD
ncbi:ABC-type sulfate transport system permease subunit [Sphingopyxis sp. OAS728]|nr:ABC-type sulfate transport system permease subunit [Sphingopyxis sp. OAS728]